MDPRSPTAPADAERAREGVLGKTKGGVERLGSEKGEKNLEREQVERTGTTYVDNSTKKKRKDEGETYV